MKKIVLITTVSEGVFRCEILTIETAFGGTKTPISNYWKMGVVITSLSSLVISDVDVMTKLTSWWLGYWYIQMSEFRVKMMGTMASQISSLTIVYSTLNSGADERKYQSSTSLAFVRGIHWWQVNSPHKWPVTWKVFPFDDIIMYQLDTTVKFEMAGSHAKVTLLEYAYTSLKT